MKKSSYEQCQMCLFLFQLFSTAENPAVVKNSSASAGDTRDVSSVPELETSLGEWNGNLIQYSCLESPLDRGICQATVHGVAKSRTWISDRVHIPEDPKRFSTERESFLTTDFPRCVPEKWHLFLRRAAISRSHPVQTDLLGRFLAGDLVLVI